MDEKDKYKEVDTINPTSQPETDKRASANLSNEKDHSGQEQK